MSDDEGEPPIAEREDLWGLLLGSKLDRILKENRTIERLVNKFSENKKEIVRFHHHSIPQLISEIKESSNKEAEGILLFLWAEYEWRNKRTGTKFILEDGLLSELQRLEEEGNIVRKLTDRFALVWSPEDKRRYLKQSDTIRSTVQTEAKPVFIQSSVDGDEVEVRGPARLLERFSGEFLQSEEVKEVEPEPTDEPILEKLSAFFENEISALTLIEAKFNSTNLPNGSSLAIDNNEGIKEDLNRSSLQSDYVGTDNLAELDYVKFIHKKSGIRIKISVEENEEGFYFEVDDSNLPEDEKKNIRELLEDKMGVSLGSLYPYDPQHHREYIINRILAENVDVYRKYYDKLDRESRKFIDEYTDAGGQDTLVCYECNEGFLEFGDEFDTCPDCGTSLMRGEPGMSIEVKEDKIFETVAENLHEFDMDIRGSEGARLLHLNFDSEEIDSNTYFKSTFQLTETAGAAGDMYWYEFFTYCLGNGDIPQRVNDYLLDTIFITYGNSEIRGRNNFGTVSLFSFLTGSNPQKQFVDAVRESQTNLRNRVREQSIDAHERLQDLQQKVDDGTIAEASFEKREELKAEYDYGEFERDVFYLFKSLFLFTERWGREGKKETDGCLIIPDGSEEYFVASYDPKLTYDSNGYDLSVDEKNKAAYYILSESKYGYISDVLKDGDTIDAHVLVSDIIREGQFEHVANTVHDWFSLTKGASEDLDVPLVFLSLDSLLNLYRVFDSNYTFIVEYPKVQRAFRTEIQNQFSTSKKYTVIDENSIEKVEERVLEARSTARKKKAAKRYSDSD